jgi:hypothetical protein
MKSICTKKKAISVNWNQNGAQTKHGQPNSQDTSMIWIWEEIIDLFPIVHYAISGWGCIKMTKSLKILQKRFQICLGQIMSLATFQAHNSHI